MDMSSIDTPKRNGMENYSPASKKLLKEIPLFDLDEKVCTTQFSNYLKIYHPNGAQGSVSKVGVSAKTPVVVTENLATLEPSILNANGPPHHIPKKKPCTPPPPMIIERDKFPKTFCDLNAGSPPDLEYNYDY